MTAPLLRVSRPLIRLTQPGSAAVPPGNRSDFGLLFSGVSTLSPFDGISGAGQRNGSHPSYVAPNGYGYGEQYPTGSTYASGFFLPQFKPVYAAVGSSLLWHGRITANSASYPYIAGKWQTPSAGGNFTGQFYLMVSAAGYIGVQIHRGASGVSTLYTSLQMPIGSPVTVLLNFRSDGVDVVTSLGREFLSLSGIGSIGSAVAAYGVTIGAPGSGYTGHQYARTGLLAWSAKTLPDSVVRNPWQIFAEIPRDLYIRPAGTGASANIAASGAAIAAGSASLAAQVALAGIGVSTADGSAVAAVGIPLSAAGLSVTGGAASAQATVTLSAAGLAQAAGQAGLSASVLLAGAGAAQAAGNATLAAQLNALASGAAQASGTANLSGGAPGTLNAMGQAHADGSAVLSVSINLAATGAAQANGTANGTASTPGALSAAGAAQAGGSATWSALVTLTGSGFVQAMGAGSFTALVPLSASGQASAGGQASAALVGQVHHFRLAATVARKTALQLSARRTTTLHHEVRHA